MDIRKDYVEAVEICLPRFILDKDYIKEEIIAAQKRFINHLYDECTDKTYITSIYSDYMLHEFDRPYALLVKTIEQLQKSPYYNCFNINDDTLKFLKKVILQEKYREEYEN